MGSFWLISTEYRAKNVDITIFDILQNIATINVHARDLTAYSKRLNEGKKDLVKQVWYRAKKGKNTNVAYLGHLL